MMHENSDVEIACAMFRVRYSRSDNKCPVYSYEIKEGMMVKGGLIGQIEVTTMQFNKIMDCIWREHINGIFGEKPLTVDEQRQYQRGFKYLVDNPD
jgi:hypothetical protein